MQDGRRKSIQPMAKRLPDGDMQSLQQFVNQSPWDHTAVLQAVALKTVPVVEPVVWVIDDVSFPKDGQMSVGVARQWCGRWASSPTACRAQEHESPASADQLRPVGVSGAGLLTSPVVRM
ncbi:SRSO17 transposase [Streptacidiphilus sp. MAP12-16]